MNPTLATPAACLVPAEWHRSVKLGVRIDPNNARLKLSGHAMGRADIARPDSSSEPIIARVGAARDLVDGLERHHCRDGSENLLLRDAHSILDADEYSRRDEIAVCESAINQAFSAD